MRWYGRRSATAALCLALASAACDQESRNQAQSLAGDAFIVTQVRAKAATIDAATVSLLQVKCDKGVVTLGGTVKSQQERSAIEDASRKVDGVKSVLDRIAVDPNAPTAQEIEADLALAARIQTALAAQTGVNAAKIHVDVHRGVVTMTGTLPSAAHRQVADQTARAVPGVNRLVDKIVVAR